MKDDMHEIANTMLGLIRSKPTQEYNIRISSERPLAVCADPSNKTLLDFFLLNVGKNGGEFVTQLWMHTFWHK